MSLNCLISYVLVTEVCYSKSKYWLSIDSLIALGMVFPSVDSKIKLWETASFQPFQIFKHLWYHAIYFFEHILIVSLNNISAFFPIKRTHLVFVQPRNGQFYLLGTLYLPRRYILLLCCSGLQFNTEFQYQVILMNTRKLNLFSCRKQ